MERIGKDAFQAVNAGVEQELRRGIEGEAGDQVLETLYLVMGPMVLDDA